MSVLCDRFSVMDLWFVLIEPRSIDVKFSFGLVDMGACSATVS